jgi:HEAT repeat protein
MVLMDVLEAKEGVAGGAIPPLAWAIKGGIAVALLSIAAVIALRSEAFAYHRLEKACERKDPEEIVLYTSHSSFKLRAMAIQCLAQTKDLAYVGTFQTLMRDPNGSVRYAAMKNVGVLAGQSAIHVLRPFLYDGDPAMRAGALHRIGELMGKTFAPGPDSPSPEDLREVEAWCAAHPSGRP